MTPPEVSVGDTETTYLESTSAAREYIAGMIEGGECSFRCRFGKAEFNTLHSLLRTSAYYWKIKFPLIDTEANNSEIAFRGHINRIGNPEVSSDGDDCIDQEITIKVTGKPAFTVAS